METIFFYSEYNVPIASVGAKGKKKKERVENLVGWLFRRRTRFLRRRELPLKRQITHLVVQGSST